MEGEAAAEDDAAGLGAEDDAGLVWAVDDGAGAAEDCFAIRVETRCGVEGRVDGVV